MLAIRLPQSVEDRLERLAARTERTKSYYARKAIEEFLEDKEDYLLAISVLEKKNKTISLEKLGEKLGLVHKSRRRSGK